MGIIDRARNALQSVRQAGERRFAARLNGEALSLSAGIPGSRGPLWEVRIDMKSEPEADGERVRVRAHFRLSLRSRAPLPPPGAGAGSTTAKLPARVGRWIERRLDSRVMQVVAAPLLDRDFSTWVEVQASTAALDEGSKALLPEKLGRLGVTPQDGRMLETWAGQVGGAHPGFATMTLLRMDKRQLPGELQQALGPGPFQMAAAVVNVVEEAL